MSLSQLLLLQDSSNFKPLHPYTKIQTAKPIRKISSPVKIRQTNTKQSLKERTHSQFRYKKQLQSHSKTSQQYNRFHRNEFQNLITKTKMLIEPVSKNKIILNRNQNTQLSSSADKKKQISFRSKQFYRSNINYWRQFGQLNPEIENNKANDEMLNKFEWSENTHSYFNRIIHIAKYKSCKQQGDLRNQTNDETNMSNLRESKVDKKSRNTSIIHPVRQYYTNRNKAKRKSGKEEITRPNTTQLINRSKKNSWQANQSCQVLQPW